MTCKHVAHVLDHSGAQHSQRLVLLALARHANEDDEAFPSVATLQHLAKLSERAVRSALRGLVAAGELTAGGESPYQTRVYVLTMVRSGGADIATPGVQSLPKGVQSLPLDGAESAPEERQTSKKEQQQQPPTPKPNGNESEAKLFETPDLITEVHELYRTTVAGKQRSRLTPTTRHLIAKALDERDVETVKRAVRGLAHSDHHRDGGWTALKYAIGKVKRDETVGDRIDMMAAKAPTTSANGRAKLSELLVNVSPGVRDVMATRIRRVREMYAYPHHEPSVEMGREALEQLRKAPARIEPIIYDGRLTGWQRAKDES